MDTTLHVKRLDPRAQLPAYQTPGSAAMDLAALLDQPLTLDPGERSFVPTGLAIALPDSGWVALLLPRSGLSIRHGITLSNSVGVIDSDYRGELAVFLTCHKREGYTVSPGERIAQMVILPVSMAEPLQVEELDETLRGAGGFGSTGKQ